MPGTTKYVDASEILKKFQEEVPSLKADDDLAAAGVDSFAVMRLCDDIGNEIGLEVNPTSVFQWGNCTKFAEGLQQLIADPNAKPAATPAAEAPAAAPPVPAPKPAEAKPPSDSTNAWVEGKPCGTGTTGLPVIEIDGKKYNLPEGQKELPPFVVDAPEDSVENLMAHLGFKDYAAPMIEEGYDDVKIIQILEDDEFGELCNDIAKMKKGHFRKFKMWKDATNMKWAGTWEDYRNSLGIDFEALYREAEEWANSEEGKKQMEKFNEENDIKDEPSGAVG